MLSISKTYATATPEHAESGDYAESGIHWEDLLNILYEIITFIIETSPALIHVADYFGLNYSAEEDVCYSFNNDAPSKSTVLILSYGLKTLDLIIKLI